MSISFKKINNVNVEPLKLPTIDIKDIKGGDIFPSTYPNVYISARKKTGKTTIIASIVPKLIDKNTHVIIISSTINTDPTYLKLVKNLKKTNQVTTYDHFLQNGMNVIEELIEHLQEEAEELLKAKKNKKKGVIQKLIKFPSAEDNDKPNCKPKKIAPEVLLVMDDLGDSLRHKSIHNLLSRNRHFKMTNILSGQQIKYMNPQSLGNLDYVLVLAGIQDDRIIHLHNSIDLGIDESLFLELYKKCTSQKYSFLYVDIRSEEYRCKFNQLIVF